MDLTTDLGKNLILRNPVLTASGTFGYGHEYKDFVNLSELGGIIVKGTTYEPRQGNAYPRICETPSGMLNAVGLQNYGGEHFAKYIWPSVKDFGTNILVNVSGAKIEDYVKTCEILRDQTGIQAIEINISCPNVKQGGMAFGTSCEGAAEVTKAVRAAWPGHLMIKLSPNVTDVVSIAKAVEAEGADSVSLINTLLGMAVDVEKMKPRLSTITGGLSGPAVKPVAVRMVWQVAKAVQIPVVGLGGIMTAADALEFIMAGATAVQVGTANFINPAVSAEIVKGIEAFMERKNISSLADIRGII